MDKIKSTRYFVFGKEGFWSFHKTYFCWYLFAFWVGGLDLMFHVKHCGLICFVSIIIYCIPLSILNMFHVKHIHGFHRRSAMFSSLYMLFVSRETCTWINLMFNGTFAFFDMCFTWNMYIDFIDGLWLVLCFVFYVKHQHWLRMMISGIGNIVVWYGFFLSIYMFHVKQ